MWRLSNSEFLFYGGIAIMGAALATGILCIIVYSITGRRLKRRLEQEYGKPYGRNHTGQ